MGCRQSIGGRGRHHGGWGDHRCPVPGQEVLSHCQVHCHLYQYVLAMAQGQGQQKVQVHGEGGKVTGQSD